MTTNTFAEMLKRRVDENAKRPHDFGAALDAMRSIKETLLHSAYSDPKADFWEISDALEIVDAYLFERATPEEMHARAGLLKKRIGGQHGPV